MVATVQVLRSSAVAVTYYERDGYYARNDPEHRQASFWHGDAAQALGLKAHVRVGDHAKARVFALIDSLAWWSVDRRSADLQC